MKLNEIFNKKDEGYSLAFVTHLKEHFIGESHLNEEEDVFSEFFGAELATRRAELKAIKYELKIAREELKIIQNFIKCAACDKRFNKDSEAMKPIWRQYNIKERRVKQLVEMRDKYIEHIKQMPIEREKTLKKIEEIKQRKQQ